MSAGDQPDLKHPHRLFIGGQWVEPSSDKRIHVSDSSTEENFLSVAEAQAADVDRAVAAAREAFDHGPWPRLSPEERAEFLQRVGSELTSQVPKIAEIWSRESGVINSVTVENAKSVKGLFSFYADLAPTFPFVEAHQPQSGKIAYLVREPVGVVAVIIPWNGPIMSIAMKATPALLAGCTVIIKASPEAPGTAYLFAEACEKIGVPAGVINVLTAEREVSELLVRHSGVDKVTFTGSTATGRRIGAICGERVARCTLELGGKSAAIILDDYDIEKAAQTLARAGMILNGQACGLLSRIIVPRRRHDAMVDALSAAYGQLKVGDPFDPTTQIGPLAMARQREKVEHLIQFGVNEGATLAVGGGRPRHLERGYYVEPTVFGNVANDSTIAREEIFGPVLSVIAADDEQSAVRIANDSIYGLNASVFTDDPDRALDIARQLRSGTVGHNDLRFEVTISFGGFKQSGVGREGGREGVYPFLEAKTVVLDELPRGH